MGFLDKLFDKREKMDYATACDYIFHMPLMQEFGYVKEHSDIDDIDYRTDIIGIVAAYMDTKTPVRTFSKFGKDILYYGTVNGTMLVSTHPIQENLKTKFLPKCEEKYNRYYQFVSEKMGNSINGTTVRLLAGAVLEDNGIAIDSAKLNSVAVDINAALALVDAMISQYRFV